MVDTKRDGAALSRFVSWLALLGTLIGLIGLTGCRKDQKAPAEVALEDGPKAPSPSPASSASARPARSSERIAALMITIAHADVKEFVSRRAKPTRSRAEALALATKIAAEARQTPARFHDLARTYSEDPFAAGGGELGAWKAGENADLDSIVAKLAAGEISDPLDTEYGYRIVQRAAALPDEPVAARQLVVAYAGATRAPAALTRSKAEARARAEDLLSRARREPAAFEALIKAESDGWDRDRAGAMGTWKLTGGRYPAAFDRAIFALKEGELSSPVESEFGIHIFQRLAVPNTAPAISGAHILIAFKGAEKARSTVTRSREEAEAEAKRIAAEAHADPARFGQLALEHSDDVTGQRGGDLGSWRAGAMPAAFDEAMSALKIGEIGGPVLTQFGYHVLLRRAAPAEKDYVVR
jgi:parvulin-like peptidyl-prolyl isomerase